MTDNTGKLPGRVVSHRLLFTASEVSNPDGTDGYQTTSQRVRTTEVQALENMYIVDTSDDLVWRALFWARVAAAPHVYAHVDPHPRKAQGGMKLYQWIAPLLGVSVEEAERLVLQAEQALIAGSR